MNWLVRRYIKTGFVFLLVGLLLGFYLILSKYLFPEWFYYGVMTLHVHLILFGFLMFLIMGVSIWMFPRLRSFGGYNQRLDEINYWILTVGTLLRTVFGIFVLFHSATIVRFAIVLGGTMQVIGCFLFIFNMWKRVRPVGKQK